MALVKVLLPVRAELAIFAIAEPRCSSEGAAADIISGVEPDRFHVQS
jgi:hypothetical protein